MKFKISNIVGVSEEIGSMVDNAQHYRMKYGENKAGEVKIIMQISAGHKKFIGELKGKTNILDINSGMYLTEPAHINTYVRCEGDGYIVNNLSFIEVTEHTKSKVKKVGIVFSKVEMLKLVEELTGLKAEID